MNEKLPIYQPFGLPATATVQLLHDLVAGDKITVNGDDFIFGTHFFTSGQGAGNKADALISLADAINGIASSQARTINTALVRDYRAIVNGTILVLVATVPGTGGNSLTLTTNASTRILVSGATFSGGTGGLTTSSSGALTVKSTDGTVFSSDLTVDTGGAYAAGDNLCSILEVTEAVQGEVAYLERVLLVDKEDKGALDIDLVFFNSSATLASNNSAWSLSDADAAKILGVVTLRANDYLDNVNNYIAQRSGESGLYLPVHAASGSSIYMGAILRSGTPTYSAATALSIELTFKQE